MLLTHPSRLTFLQGSLTVKCRQRGDQHLHLLLPWGQW